MTIDPKTLPEGLYQIRFPSGREYVVVQRDGALYGPKDWRQGNPKTWGNRFDHPEVAIPLVPVPDGMDVEKAAQVLADHVEWVPLPDGPTEAHVGKRLHCEDRGYGFGFDITPEQVVTGSFGALWGGGGMHFNLWAKARDRVWFIHPDDVPGPDAELIEAMARTMCDDVGGDSWDYQSETDRDAWRGTARAALAVVREREARS